MRASVVVLGLASSGCATAMSENVNVASEATIDGRQVSDAQFDAFERALTDRKDTITCAETNTGGFSEYEAIDASGVRYRVRLESRNGKSLREATRAALSP
ncbi:MAG: hypothetical protein JST54_22475 [Deltaproteobacteria bacterium]|nr:hypothetical protein [Deltaproteobacteria bacterium]